MAKVDKRTIITTVVERGYKVDKAGNVFDKHNTLRKLCKSGNYLAIPVYVQGQKTFCRVDVLQAYQRYGEEAIISKIIHKDGDNFNNSYDNITIEAKRSVKRFRNYFYYVRCGFDYVKDIADDKIVYLTNFVEKAKMFQNYNEAKEFAKLAKSIEKEGFEVVSSKHLPRSVVNNL